MTCTCGHVEDEHETACEVEGCDCIYFEWDGEEEEDGEPE